jgi:hypothetical protein
LSPLNGLINFRASLTYIYIFSHDFTPRLLLSFKRSALYGERLTARKIRVTAACGAAPRSSALSGWLLPRRLLPLFLLPLAAGCCPVSAPGCCPVSAAGCFPSFCCTWRVAAAPSLRLVAASSSAALDGCCCCPVPAAGSYPSFSESR